MRDQGLTGVDPSGDEIEYAVRQARRPERLGEEVGVERGLGARAWPR